MFPEQPLKLPAVNQIWILSSGNGQQLASALVAHLKGWCYRLWLPWIHHLPSLVGYRAQPAPVLGDVMSMMPEQSRLGIHQVLQEGNALTYFSFEITK